MGPLIVKVKTFVKEQKDDPGDAFFELFSSIFHGGIAQLKSKVMDCPKSRRSLQPITIAGLRVRTTLDLGPPFAMSDARP